MRLACNLASSYCNLNLGEWIIKYRILKNDIMTAIMDDCTRPLFTFGVIADIQYADVDDGYNYRGTRKRYYRSSLALLRRANESWTAEDVKPSFILQLGDIIDGVNKKYNTSERALETVLKEFDLASFEVHHVWGNHEFYNFSRGALQLSVLNSTPDTEDSGTQLRNGDIYAYHFSPAPNFRFVVLDAYDVSLIGREESSEQYLQAKLILKEHNGNEDLNQPPVVTGLEQRFVKFNGGFSVEQLEWLDEVLTISDKKREKVTVVSHLPVHPRSTDPICLPWNQEALLSVLHAHPSLVCFMAGHDHDGGYHQDELSGAHHLTLEGVIETPPEGNAFGTVFVFQDRMVLKGSGRIPDRTLLYPLV